MYIFECTCRSQILEVLMHIANTLPVAVFLAPALTHSYARVRANIVTNTHTHTHTHTFGFRVQAPCNMCLCVRVCFMIYSNNNTSIPARNHQHTTPTISKNIHSDTHSHTPAHNATPLEEIPNEGPTIWDLPLVVRTKALLMQTGRAPLFSVAALTMHGGALSRCDPRLCYMYVKASMSTGQRQAQSIVVKFPLHVRFSLAFDLTVVRGKDAEKASAVSAKIAARTIGSITAELASIFYYLILQKSLQFESLKMDFMSMRVAKRGWEQRKKGRKKYSWR